MTKGFREWRRMRRYRSTVRSLRALPGERLADLGIRPGQIERLAWEASTSWVRRR